MQSRKLDSLTGLRFFAALMVVFYHYQYYFPFSLPSSINRVVSHGNVGVSLFFILSGFILTFKYFDWFTSDLSKYRIFIQARFARIYPLHFAALLLITPLSIISILNHNPFIAAASGIQTEITSQGLVSSWLNNLFLLQSIISDSTPLWNSPSWSLSCEVIFYLTLPFFIRYFLAKIRGKVNLVFLAFIFYFLQILFFFTCYAILLLHNDYQTGAYQINGFLYSSPLLRIWEFFIGCIFGLLYLDTNQIGCERNSGLATKLVSISGKRMKHFGIFLIFGFIMCAVFFESNSDLIDRITGPAQFYLVYVPPFAVLILILSSGRTFFDRILQFRPVQFLGEASYSLYMIHWLIMLCISNEIFNFLQSNIIKTFIGVGLTIVLSIFFYQKVEIPARLALRAKQ